MRKWKQALALVLALVMALSLVALPSFAADEDSTGTGTAQPAWPAEGSIKLDKDASAVEGQENLWEVTLGIQGKNYKTTSDVVLVIDNSNSMYTKKYGFFGSVYYEEDSSCRMYQTKAAANAFIDSLLTEDSTTRIAVVVFSLKVAQTGFYTYANKSELQTYINSIEPEKDSDDGGTFTQLGLKTARDILNSDASTGGNKSIVLLSDGVPTASYYVAGTATGTCTTRRGTTTHNTGYDENSVQVTGCEYNQQAGDGSSESDGRIKLTLTCPHGETADYNQGRYTSINHSYATVWEAGQALSDGMTVYSVALQAGTDGENILKACATNPNKGFFAISKGESDVAGKLKDAFTAIAGSIAIAAKAGAVNDIMGEKVQLSFSGSAPVIATDKAVYDAGNADVYISQGSAAYDPATRAINWTVGNVSEGDNPIMKYKVTVRDGYNPSTGEVLDANEEATFRYKNYLGQDTDAEFPVPQVTVGGGNILVHYYLVNDQGQPINESGVVVESPALAKQVKTAAYFQVNGKTGLDYNTPYTVPFETVDNYNYFGSYILNNGALTQGNSVSVTLTAANSNQHVWFAYYQTFNVAHVRMADDGTAEVVHTDTYTAGSNFDLTEKVNVKKDGTPVTEGTFLYGGAFENLDCTTTYPFAGEGETGLSFTPTAGETYYIWEVPSAYLVPKTLAGWEHNQNNQLDVIAFYMMAGIDREYYAGVGFTVNGEDKLSNQNTLIDYSTGDNQGSTKVVSLTPGQSAGFQSVELKRKDGNTQTYTVTNVVPGYDKGFIACYGLAQAEWKDTDVTTAYTPYWITLDGVKVTSGVTRTATYQGVGYQRLDTKNTGDASNPVYAKNTQTATRLMTFASYLADSTPIAQETPTVDNVTVTVKDNDKTTQVEIPCGASVRDQVAYQAPAGKAFAGWFTDETYTTPANLDSITEDITVYAKYVSDSYLDLHYVRNGLFRLRGVTLISAVDSEDNYAESGIIVDGVEVPVTYASRYMLFNTPASLFGAPRGSQLMIADKSLSGSGTLEVTPYWVTLDGTKVLGETQTLHYNARTIWE